MTREDHHLLCLGLLAKLFNQSRDFNDFTDLNHEDKLAIIEAVESAEALGLPVSKSRLCDGFPISTTPRN